MESAYIAARFIEMINTQYYIYFFGKISFYRFNYNMIVVSEKQTDFYMSITQSVTHDVSKNFFKPLIQNTQQEPLRNIL